MNKEGIPHIHDHIVSKRTPIRREGLQLIRRIKDFIVGTLQIDFLRPEGSNIKRDHLLLPCLEHVQVIRIGYVFRTKIKGRNLRKQVLARDPFDNLIDMGSQRAEDPVSGIFFNKS
jgi:hypothetical protein